MKEQPIGLGREERLTWNACENPGRCRICTKVYEQDTLNENFGICESCYGNKDEIIMVLTDHIDGIEDERNVYLAYFEAVGIDVTIATRIGRQSQSYSLNQ